MTQGETVSMDPIAAYTSEPLLNVPVQMSNIEQAIRLLQGAQFLMKLISEATHSKNLANALANTEQAIISLRKTALE